MSIAHLNLRTIDDQMSFTKRTFDDFLPQSSRSISSTETFDAGTTPSDQASSTETNDEDGARPTEARLSPIRTQTITTMLDLIRKQGDIDLAVHLLRTSLREASSSRQAWLSRVLAHDVEGQHTIASTKWMTSRPLLVSGQWFELVHNLARTRSGSIWAADLLRTLMDTESRAIQAEYRLLTDLDIDQPIRDIPPTAMIHKLQSPPSSNPKVRVFNTRRHLVQLKQTHGELISLSAHSVRQVEHKRQLRALSNARRRERAAFVAAAEAERLELKKAGRRQRQEVQEATLVMA